MDKLQKKQQLIKELEELMDFDNCIHPSEYTKKGPMMSSNGFSHSNYYRLNTCRICGGYRTINYKANKSFDIASGWLRYDTYPRDLLDGLLNGSCLT